VPETAYAPTSELSKNIIHKLYNEQMDYTVNFKELNQLKKFYSVTKNGLKRLQNNTFGVD
jgi:hypothetical protein